MADETLVLSPETTMKDYMDARKEGKIIADAPAEPTAAEKPEISKPEEPTEAQAKTPSESETEETEAGESEKKSKSKLQKRFDKLTADKYRLEGELEALRSQKQEPAPKPKEGEPKIDDFSDLESYYKAQARWEVKQELAEQKAAEEKKAEETKGREILETYQKRVTDIRTKHEDWDEVYESIGDATLPPSVQLAILELEEGPEVVYQLAKNAELREKLNTMSAPRAIAEIGRIAASLSKSETPAPEKRPVSTAPAPIKPLGGAATKSQVALDELPMKQYIEARKSGRTS